MPPTAEPLKKTRTHSVVAFYLFKLFWSQGVRYLVAPLYSNETLYIIMAVLLHCLFE